MKIANMEGNFVWYWRNWRLEEGNGRLRFALSSGDSCEAEEVSFQADENLGFNVLEHKEFSFASFHLLFIFAKGWIWAGVVR
jgi:hypothetical protein